MAFPVSLQIARKQAAYLLVLPKVEVPRKNHISFQEWVYAVAVGKRKKMFDVHWKHIVVEEEAVGNCSEQEKAD